MEKTKKTIPFIATHPGTLIRDELDMMPEMKQIDLAKLLEVRPSFLSEVINGKRPVTSKLALKLEKALGISADYWNRSQAQYNLDSMRIENRDFETNASIELTNNSNSSSIKKSLEIKMKVLETLEIKGKDQEFLCKKLNLSSSELHNWLDEISLANYKINQIEEVVGEKIIHINKPEAVVKTKYKTIIIRSSSYTFESSKRIDKLAQSGNFYSIDQKKTLDTNSDLN